MEAEHPKVRLDTNSEYHHIYSKVEQAARQRIEAHFAEQSATNINKDDAAYRKAVEAGVLDYISRLFTLANHSISINGNDIPTDKTPASLLAASKEDEFEPFDDALRQRVQQLQADVGSAVVNVTTLRREVPKREAEKYKIQLEQEIARDLALLGEGKELNDDDDDDEGHVDEGNREGEEMAIDNDDDDDGGGGGGNADQEGTQQKKRKTNAGKGKSKAVDLKRPAVHLEPFDLGGKPLERQDEIQRTWEASMKRLGALKDDLPATMHKIMRAQEAVDYLNEKKRKAKT